jgi:hypothetical protein
MMNHQEWTSNRGYQQHLSVLTKIYTGPSSRAKTLNHAHSTRLRPSHPERASREERPASPELQPARSRENLTMREQQILWDNYHLGKRIIETSPVISKQRLDEDYRKHKQLVHYLTGSASKKANPAEFRLKSKRRPS